MAVRDWPTLSGKERERDARVTPADIADARASAAPSTTDKGRRMLRAVVSDDSDDAGPIPDE